MFASIKLQQKFNKPVITTMSMRDKNKIALQNYINIIQEVCVSATSESWTTWHRITDLTKNIDNVMNLQNKIQNLLTLNIKMRRKKERVLYIFRITVLVYFVKFSILNSVDLAQLLRCVLKSLRSLFSRINVTYKLFAVVLPGNS